MTSKLRLLAAGAFLAAVSAGYGQPTLQFATATYTVAETAGAVTLTVRRLNDTNSAVTVDYATANGTATAGLDYTATNGTLAFAAGETNQTITVPILNDGLVESTETFTVTLSNPTGGGAVLGAPATATESVTDNDRRLQLEFAKYDVAEGAGVVLLGVLRGDDGQFPVSVKYATSDSTAKSGLDYTGVTNTLLFAAGEGVKTFIVPILNDGLKESTETFSVRLSNPTNQVLGTPVVATITIFDNDPGVQFELNRYWVRETDGALKVKVVRGSDGGDLGPFTVDFAMSDLTATNGVDYIATNGTLSFAQGEMAKAITVPILFDEVLEPDRQFKLLLSNLTGGLVLGAQATATVTVLDTTGMEPHQFEGIAALPDGRVRASLGGGVSKRFKDCCDLYPIEVSSNLMDWAPSMTLERTNPLTSPLTYTETPDGNWPVQFSRTPSNHLITPFSVKPTGPYAVGVLSRLLTDPARRNRNNVSTNSSFMVSVWYPALAQATQLPGPLLDARIAEDPFFAEQMFAMGYTDCRATNVVDRAPRLVQYAVPDAVLATNAGPCPVLLCSPQGYGWRASLAEKAANFASHGYIVAVSDPREGPVTVLPDGTYLTLSYTYKPAPADYVQDRLNDLVFLLDEVTRWNADDPVLGGGLDLTEVATMGTCVGFQAAAEFCRRDPRCKAAILVSCAPSRWVSMSTIPWPELESSGVGKPILVVFAAYADAANYYDFLYNKNSKDATAFQIQGAETGGYYGMIMVQDFYTLLEPNRLEVGRDASRIITDYSLWFLNKYLKGSSDPVPALAQYPRVTGFKQK